MIYILYGPDTYRSRRKVQDIIRQYIERTGSDINLHRFDAQEDNLDPVSAVIYRDSLFSKKSLVVIEYLLSSEKFNSLRAALKECAKNKEVVVILWEPELSKEAKRRFSEIKNITTKIQKFPILKGEMLRKWILQEASARGAKLFPGHLAYLESMQGDLWLTKNELDKYELYPAGYQIGGMAEEYKVFDLGDALFKDAGRALNVLISLLNQGADPFSIFGYVVSYVRTLFIVKSCQDFRRPISKSYHIHPFVEKKAKAALRGLTLKKLQTTLFRLLIEDYYIKTGQSHPEQSLFRIIIQTSKKPAP